MIRKHETTLATKAGALSLLVHALFFLLLFVSFNWKTVQPLQVSDVELWDALPTPPVVAKAEPKPEPPKPVIEAKPEPPPPPPEPKAEIAVEKPKPKPVEKPKPKEEKPKPDPKLKAEEEKRRIQKLLAAEDTEMQKEQQQREAQQVSEAHKAQAAAQLKGALDEYLGHLKGKIRQYVNPQVCGDGKPVLKFNIALMPTGELLAPPRLKTSSKIRACDEAVERAILQAAPFAPPTDPDLIADLRDLDLVFKPNE